MDSAQCLQEANALFQQGKLPEAEAGYRQILQDEPEHAEALHNMGAVALRSGNAAAALPFFQKALVLNEAVGPFWFSLIQCFRVLGQVEKAREVFFASQARGFAGDGFLALYEVLDIPLLDGEVAVLKAASPELRVYQGRVVQQRQSSYLEYPAHVHLETFAQCNAACVFCPYPTLERKGERMSDDLLEKVLCDLEDIPKTHAFQLSPFKVNEPFLDHRLFNVLEQVRKRLPNASITLTSNASPITEEKLARLAEFEKIGYLWISFNDHRQEEYEATMKLPYERTIQRLNAIHEAKVRGDFRARVVLSRVGDGSEADQAFVAWVRERYPLFETSIFQRGEWLGQVETAQGAPAPNVGCNRWFDVSITATGVVAHCCMDGKAEYPIGDVRHMHVLEIYNQPEYRRLREATVSRRDVEPCKTCHFL